MKNQTQMIREALTISLFPSLVQFHYTQWFNQLSPATRANLKLAFKAQGSLAHLAKQAAYDNTHSGYHIHSWSD